MGHFCKLSRVARWSKLKTFMLSQWTSPTTAMFAQLSNSYLYWQPRSRSCGKCRRRRHRKRRKRLDWDIKPREDFLPLSNFTTTEEVVGPSVRHSPLVREQDVSRRTSITTVKRLAPVQLRTEDASVDRELMSWLLIKERLLTRRITHPSI
jgi:hypothetical protein